VFYSIDFLDEQPARDHNHLNLEDRPSDAWSSNCARVRPVYHIWQHIVLDTDLSSPTQEQPLHRSADNSALLARSCSNPAQIGVVLIVQPDSEQIQSTEPASFQEVSHGRLRTAQRHKEIAKEGTHFQRLYRRQPSTLSERWDLDGLRLDSQERAVMREREREDVETLASVAWRRRALRAPCSFSTVLSRQKVLAHLPVFVTHTIVAHTCELNQPLHTKTSRQFAAPASTSGYDMYHTLCSKPVPHSLPTQALKQAQIQKPKPEPSIIATESLASNHSPSPSNPPCRPLMPLPRSTPDSPAPNIAASIAF
jgi:hypothetical protein